MQRSLEMLYLWTVIARWNCLKWLKYDDKPCHLVKFHQSAMNSTFGHVMYLSSEVTNVTLVKKAYIVTERNNHLYSGLILCTNTYWFMFEKLHKICCHFRQDQPMSSTFMFCSRSINCVMKTIKQGSVAVPCTLKRMKGGAIWLKLI